ncbi:GTPase-associated system all-helical protein GASH [Phaeobacter gallaeciensis]|uniref:GTPase-associated system all-helical protein GASH n=1 Tax=Phaeobacter gallaeciensis TaxID=60890 RepID=UPI00237FA18A|nr:GTPase-associated system all-helical protein GASH [Phaeobacter gallaeciensis]MDE4139998.1 GTPase-associated system all-helical protein GASH [Phaeobacter gallaeciensis]MDE4148392.1 GTPase-associated system all-helical protein GASH [Phaeobacter gallaeciensis]MDE4152664.1 GTPase-associated system all-helical protein GASH [Phaeobacter gallaeciensis]MDE4228002.1 GTPase-associated system all-helical protein GASH [Phaeobacter gallaeciensis]MDE4257129.1 GTPase-associated system all-helical protein 
MKEISLADCYGHAGLSSEAANIAPRLEAFDTISRYVDKDRTIDLVRFYYGLPVTRDTDWFSAPITDADPTFSMVTNKREVSIIAMALLANEIAGEDSALAALAVLVANASGRRKPAVWPQFVEIVSAAAQDLAISDRRSAPDKQIKIRQPSAELGGAQQDLITAMDPTELNTILKKLNVDSYEMDRFLANQVTTALQPLREEIASLREEKDMLWWLIGGHSYRLQQSYASMKKGKAAFMIGLDLAKLCRTGLGPYASEFLIAKALGEGRDGKQEKLKVEALPKLFGEDELKAIAYSSEIEELRDLCFLNNAINRANDLGLPNGWKKKYGGDGSLSDSSSFETEEIALQSFREALLLQILAE